MPNIFRISKDYQRFPKITEDNRRLLRKIQGCFDHAPTNMFEYNLRDKRDINEIIDILTSEDMENTVPLESQKWLPINFTSGVFSSKTLVSI